MAVLKIRMCSKKLMRNVNFNVILPFDKEHFDGNTHSIPTPLKTIYLLHGIFGDADSWLYSTNIVSLATEKNLAVVLPSGENMFYLDKEFENNFYGQFIGEELVEMTRLMFPLSHKREDTFICGLSMGGYGAIRNGLKYSHVFGAVAGLSSALITENLNKFNDEDISIRKKSFAKSIFGDLDLVSTSDKSPKYIAEKFANNKEDFPKLFLSCGTEDSLINENRDFKEYLEKLNLPLTYEELPGGHTWDYWDKAIVRVLDWLNI